MQYSFTGYAECSQYNLSEFDWSYMFLRVSGGFLLDFYWYQTSPCKTSPQFFFIILFYKYFVKTLFHVYIFMFLYDTELGRAVSDGLKHFSSCMFCLIQFFNQCPMSDCCMLNKIVITKKKRMSLVLHCVCWTKISLKCALCKAENQKAFK